MFKTHEGNFKTSRKNKTDLKKCTNVPYLISTQIFMDLGKWALKVKCKNKEPRIAKIYLKIKMGT